MERGVSAVQTKGVNMTPVSPGPYREAPPCEGLCRSCRAEGCGKKEEAGRCFRIRGGRPLKGSVSVHGAKNSVLPIFAAAVLCRTPVHLARVPRLSDTGVSLRILESLGCISALSEDEAVVDPSAVTGSRIPDRLVREMRSSSVFLGSVAARTGEAYLCLPGGCELGARPIDLHLMGLRALGMTIEEKGEKLHAYHNGLKGADITLPFPSVGATENILMAAVLAKGRTVLRGAAREPEIQDLCRFLRRCGAGIVGDGGPVLYIDGVPELMGCSYAVMGDRIEAATLLIAAAVTGGEVEVRGFSPADTGAVLGVLRRMGARLRVYRDRVQLSAPHRLITPGRVDTAPFPGFPTDVQPVLSAAAALAEGETVIGENIFDSRFKHLSQLVQMGADIRIDGRTAYIRGVESLHGAGLKALDLRGGAALVTAALAAEGESRIGGLQHIERGYERLEETLSALGAEIERV